MSDLITSELVDAVARYAVDAAMLEFGDNVPPFAFDGMEHEDQADAREAAQMMLQLVVPVLLSHQWRPPMPITDIPF